MPALKIKRIKENVLSHKENKILKDILKQLLGPGLVEPSSNATNRKVQKNIFLREALNSESLNKEISA